MRKNGSYLALGTAASASVASRPATQTKMSSNSPTPMFSPGTSVMTLSAREEASVVGNIWNETLTYVTTATDKRNQLRTEPGTRKVFVI